MLQSKVPDVVRGHEIWLEYTLRFGSEGREFDGRLCFGHNMAVDGVADLSNAKAFVIDPDNRRNPLDMLPGENALEMTFRP